MGILNTEELLLITHSWQLVVPNVEKHGLNFFLKLFDEYPAYKEKFFPDIHQDNKKLQRHGTIVMKSVGKLVAFLEANKIIPMVETIKRIANNHYRRGVLSEQFRPVCNVLLVYLRDSLGSSLPNEGVEAWKKFLGLFVSIITEAYDEIRIKEKLPYIKSLGVNAIWFSPFYKSGSKDLSYDVKDHKEINSLLGTKEDVLELLTMMKEKGLYAILSFIPNHTSEESEWFKKSKENDPDYRDYYVWRDDKNDWISATEETAWSKVDDEGQYYLHHFLPQMPDLNLTNEKVRHEMKEIMRYWLQQPAVYGLHISGVNLLIENFDNSDVVHCDVQETLKLLDEWKEVTEEHLDQDNLRRLLILEMLQTEHISDWRTLFLNSSFGTAVLPFTFGRTLSDDDIPNKGDELGYKIRNYVHDVPNLIWPNWEIDNTNMIGLNKGYGRVPGKMNRESMMMTMLLPGSVILYYGDEIGMVNNYDIPYDEIEDPYPTEENYKVKSRDPSRCPMQWSSEKYAGFTNGSEAPWLPIHSSYPDVNVESESRPNSKVNNLRLYKELLNLRLSDDFHEGKVYFPYQGSGTFTFIRKLKDSNTAYLVVALLSDTPHFVDFTLSYPNFPKEGTVVFITEEYDCDYIVSDVVDLSNLQLSSHIGIVIKITLSDSEPIEKILQSSDDP